jgi:multiple sugar transport system substrate-binding protein
MKKFLVIIVLLSLLFSLVLGVDTFAAKKKLSVLYGGAPLPKEETFRQLILLYQKENPDVEVEIVTLAGTFWDQVKVIAAAGNLPDVMRLDDDWSGEHMIYGNVLDITDRVLKEINPKDFTIHSWIPFVYKGRIYGLPYDAAVDVIYYNVKLFKDAGLTLPSRDPKKWTNSIFLDAAKKLTKDLNGDGIPDQWGFTYPGATTGYYQAQHWLWREGETIYNPDKTECTLPLRPKAVEALQFYTDLRNKYGVMPPIDVVNQMGARPLFTAGKVGMYLDANWGIPDLEKARKAGTLEYGIAFMPTGSKGQVTRITCDAWGITKNCKDIELAWHFLKWMSSADKGQKYMAKLGTFTPPNLKVALDPKYMYDKDTYYDESIFVRIMQNYSRMGEICLQGAEVADAWTRAMEPLFLGKVNALEAAREYKKIVDPILQREAKFRPFAPWYVKTFEELIALK